MVYDVGAHNIVGSHFGHQHILQQLQGHARLKVHADEHCLGHVGYLLLSCQLQRDSSSSNPSTGISVSAGKGGVTYTQKGWHLIARAHG